MLYSRDNFTKSSHREVRQLSHVEGNLYLKSILFGDEVWGLETFNEAK